MVADPNRLRFYVDESALGLGKALAAARSDTIHVGHPLIPECPVGVLDPEWIPAVAGRNLVAIGRDKRIRTKHEEIRQLMAANLRVLTIGGSVTCRPGNGWFVLCGTGIRSNVSSEIVRPARGST